MTDGPEKNTHFNENLNCFMDASPDGILICDPYLNLIEINSAGLSFFPAGTRKEDLAGKNLLDSLPELSRVVDFNDCLEMIRRGETYVDNDAVLNNASNCRYYSVRVFKSGDGIGIIITDRTGLKRLEGELARQKELFINQTKKCYDELSGIGSMLIEEKEKNRRAEEKLKESELRNRILAESSLQGVLIIQDGRFAFANEAFANIMGYTVKEILSMSSDTITDMIYFEDRSSVLQRIQDRLEGKPVPPRFEQRVVCKDGDLRWVETYAKIIDYMGEPAIQSTFVDITDRKNLEMKRRRYHEHLEELVRKRTANLEEANTALKVLLKKGKEDSAETEKKILINIKKIIMPYIEKLRTSGLNSTQKNYLDIVESNLHDLTSPFIRGVTSESLELTETEIQVGNMIRAGKKSREIAMLMGLSTRTVEAYRYRIRDKIGIKNKRINLKTYLSTIC